MRQRFQILSTSSTIIRRKVTSFEIDDRGTGAFPSAKNPRVLWLGVNEPTGAMKDLATHIDKDLHQLGFESRNQRAFKPHLTLARIRDPRNAGEIGMATRRKRVRPIWLYVLPACHLSKAISAAPDRHMKNCTWQNSASNHSAHAAAFAAFLFVPFTLFAGLCKHFLHRSDARQHRRCLHRHKYHF